MKGKLELEKIEDQPDGSAIMYFDIDDEFKDYFKETYGLQRFSKKRFEKFIIEAIEHAVASHDDGKEEDNNSE